jgi:hypothetical protein
VACGQTPGKLKPALPPEHDVYQDNIWPQLLCMSQRLSRGSGDADDAQTLLSSRSRAASRNNQLSSTIKTPSAAM